MFKSIKAIIEELESALHNHKSCHQINPYAADQEMLQEITINNCIDECDCTFPECDKWESIITDCLTRWKHRNAGETTEKDRILMLYYILSNFI